MNRYLRGVIATSLLVAPIALVAQPASAHPLGNFTTNTAAQVTIQSESVETRYAVDLAEIPTLRVRQQLGFAKSDVPGGVSAAWASEECRNIARRFDVTAGGRRLRATVSSSTAAFSEGQAGLQTLRLDCTLRSNALASSIREVSINDRNYVNRQGWRELSVRGAGRKVSSTLPSSSPTALLTSYPDDALASPSDVRSGRVSVGTPTADNYVDAGTDAATGTNTGGATQRVRDVVPDRFASLVSVRELHPFAAAGAIMLAILLGAIHAMAPGHGKSLMAAYVVGRRVGRRGARRDLLTIGGTVAATHTVGVLALGGLALLGTAERTGALLRWLSAVSGALVVVVGVGILRSRLRARRALQATHGAHEHDRSHHEHAHDAHDHPHHEHDHSHHEHAHDAHDHPHHEHGHAHDEHDHEHGHAHDEHDPAHKPHAHAKRPRFAILRRAVDDNRLEVTTHAHGGVAHTHVLPAPGATIRRRELLAMGFAGGLVPSPSALLVLLGGIGLGRAWFGVVLVLAYGIGLALALLVAGILLATFEHRVRAWSASASGTLTARAVNAIPLVSACVLVTVGLVTTSRAIL